MNVPYATSAPPAVVYRVSRSVDPCTLPAWAHILAGERGRFDDPHDEFRGLYASTSAAGALTEVLADLRPRFDRMLQIAMIEGEDEAAGGTRLDLVAMARAAMEARLAGRYLAEIEILNRDEIFVDLGAGASRSRLELALGVERLKIGDLTGRDRTLSRRAARAVFDDGHPGLIAPSAEYPHAQTVAIFETAGNSNVFRTPVKVISVLPADSYRNAVAAAIDSLLRIDQLSPLLAPDANPSEALMLRRAIIAFADLPPQLSVSDPSAPIVGTRSIWRIGNASVGTSLGFANGSCAHCGHEWLPRKDGTYRSVCPRCKSPYWSTPRRETHISPR